MKRLLDVGRVLFAIALLGFGCEYALYAMGQSGPIPGPPWHPASPMLAGVWAAALVIAGICLLLRFHLQTVAALVSACLFVDVLIIYLPWLMKEIRNPAPWTSGGEMLALSGGALALSGWARGGARGKPMIEIGKVMFALLLIVVGVQHIMYGRFVATLVPAWIPAHYFLVIFIGVAFLAAAAAFVSGILAQTAAYLLGVMFAIFVLTVHAPRIVGKLHDGNEWTSGLVAVAMCGCSFIFAEVLEKRKRT